MSGGWPTRKLVDLCDVFADGDWIETKDQSSEGIRLIQTGNIGAGVFKDREEKARFISNATFERLRCTEVFEGDCLISRLPDPVGRSCTLPFTGERMITAVDCTIVRFDSKQIIPAFFTYYSQSLEYLAAVDRETTGTTRKRISRSNLGEVSVPLPSLSEQQRIVAILDEAFDGIATAKANAEKNLQNARALFESHLQFIFAQHGKGWDQKSLGEVSSFENGDRGTNYPSKAARTTSGVPFINAGHLSDDGIDFKTMDYISRERFNLLSNGKIQREDILFCLRGSLGKFASVGGLTEGAIASSLVIVRPGRAVLSEYIVTYFRSSLCAEMIDRFKNGAAQPNLSAQSLRRFIIPVPSLPQQELVVAEVTKLRCEIRKLGSIYEQKLAAFEALKKSLLHQAFSGHL